MVLGFRVSRFFLCLRGFRGFRVCRVVGFVGLRAFWGL